MTVDELAQEIPRFDQKCAHLSAEREALRIVMDTQDKLESIRHTATLLRCRVDCFTAELIDKMKLIKRRDPLHLR